MLLWDPSGSYHTNTTNEGARTMTRSGRRTSTRLVDAARRASGNATAPTTSLAVASNFPAPLGRGGAPTGETKPTNEVGRTIARSGGLTPRSLAGAARRTIGNATATTT